MDHNTTSWRKSSYSGTESNCVELAMTVERTAIRDSKAPDSGALEVPRGAAIALFTQLRAH
ncbi:DUF397 domain-containing protein [Amycolatopsis palatopharyngis]|uniref:DUF397 domain-containing protein n=1 Tax=Amycolatopsis palatopharyngis TaxID=187982 RepID=UPI000E259F90|nr:DUF397 domain-containing protein [Amycolatopsis palatopharyngis]